MDDKYSLTRARNALVTLITSIESLEPPSYWYNITENSIGSLCELFRLEECVFLSIMRTCGLIRQKMTNGKSSYIIEHLKWNALLSQYALCDVEISTSKVTLTAGNKTTRKSMTFIRIGTKSSYSYTKPIKQYNSQVLPPLVNMRLLSSNFVNSISTDVIESINWSENEGVSIPVSCKYIPSNFSKSTSTSTSTSYDNPPILPSLFPILDQLEIITFKLDNKPLNVIFLKNLLSEVSCVLTDNNISMNLEK